MNSIVYIHRGFWQNLPQDKSIEGLRARLDVSDFLNASDIITDIPIEDIKEDRFLSILLLKEQQPTPCDSEYINKKVSRIDNTSSTDDLCATYLLDKTSEECDDIEKDYGVVALCAESLPNRQYLFKGDGFTPEKNKKHPQRYLEFNSKLSHPCNSAIIIDPYLLHDRKEENGSIQFPGITNNLESLLDAILPKKLKIDYHLTIMSSLEDPKNVDKAYEEVKGCVMRIRKDLTVKIGLVYISKGYRHDVESFHSRHIQTNSFAIDSEDGLDLFNDKGYLTKNNPSVSIVFPRLFGNSRQDITKYTNWIRSTNEYIKTKPKHMKGNLENRLFDLVN